MDSNKNVQNNISAVLCDVGGVLIHKIRTPELQRWEQHLHVQPGSLPLSIWLCESALRATLGQGNVDGVWKEIQQTYTLTDMELTAFKHDFMVSEQLDEKFVEFLQEIHKTRKVALLSNAWPDARHIFGIDFGLNDVADMMILSCEENLAKPDPRIYDLAAKRLQLPHSSIIFIDDYAPNVAAAQATGMHGIIFETSEQTMVQLNILLYEQEVASS